MNAAPNTGESGKTNHGEGTGPDNWQIAEYWTPMIAYTLWLLAELSAVSK
jgi:hypothetical protein